MFLPKPRKLINRPKQKTSQILLFLDRPARALQTNITVGYFQSGASALSQVIGYPTQCAHESCPTFFVWHMLRAFPLRGHSLPELTYRSDEESPCHCSNAHHVPAFSKFNSGSCDGDKVQHLCLLLVTYSYKTFVWHQNIVKLMVQMYIQIHLLSSL